MTAGLEQPQRTIVQRLRSDTLPAHLKIESVLNLNRPDYKVSDLRSLLIGFFTFHRSWEPLVASRLEADRDWFDPRRKLHLLESDLRYLGIDPQDHSLPVCQKLPPIADRFDALGSMYVLEGSTLGGQLVGRFLSSQLSLQNGRGYSYFLSYGADVGRMWREFSNRLLAEIPDANCPIGDGIVASANQTFGHLTNWLVTVREQTCVHVEVDRAAL